jgi:hypothetical protein
MKNLPKLGEATSQNDSSGLDARVSVPSRDWADLFRALRKSMDKRTMEVVTPSKIEEAFEFFAKI